MSDIKNGGPAFPVLENYSTFNEDTGKYEEAYAPTGGMTLRDYFAIRFAVALVSRGELKGGRPTLIDGCFRHADESEIVARDAHEYADAMLKAREAK